MNALTLNALIIVFCFCLALIKQIKPEYSAVAGALVAIVISAIALKNVYPLIEYSESLFLDNGNTEYLKIVMKALGVAILSSLAVEICRDAGQNSLAYAIEMFCKCEIIAMSLPLIIKILEMAKELMTGDV